MRSRVSLYLSSSAVEIARSWPVFRTVGARSNASLEFACSWSPEEKYLHDVNVAGPAMIVTCAFAVGRMGADLAVKLATNRFTKYEVIIIRIYILESTRMIT